MQEGPKVPEVTPAEKKRRSTLKNIEFILFDQAIVTRSLFVLAVLYTMYFVANLLMPICLAFLLYFLFYPMVNTMQKKANITPFVGSGIVIFGLLFLGGFIFYILSAQAQEWTQREGDIVSLISQKVSSMTSFLQKPMRALSSISSPQTNLFGALFTNTYQFVVNCFTMLIFLYFLLAAKNFFLTKIVKVLLHLKRKKEAHDIVQQIEDQVWDYLFLRTMANIGVAVVVSLMLWAFGVPNPFLWGVMAGVLEYIPFIGAFISFFVILAVCLLSFDTGWQILLPPISFALFIAVVGNFYIPYILGKSMTINQVALLFSIFLFGTIWGVMGSFLAVPLLMTIKIIIDTVNEDNFMNELLAE